MWEVPGHQYPGVCDAPLRQNSSGTSHSQSSSCNSRPDDRLQGTVPTHNKSESEIVSVSMLERCYNTSPYFFLQTDTEIQRSNSMWRNILRNCSSLCILLNQKSENKYLGGEIFYILTPEHNIVIFHILSIIKERSEKPNTVLSSGPCILQSISYAPCTLV